MNSAANPPEKSPQERSHDMLQQAEAALDRGDARKALELAKRSYQSSPGSYPTNYNALSLALDCLKKLGLNEEANTIQETMERLLMQHNTKPHAEGEARKQHPLKEKRGL